MLSWLGRFYSSSIGRKWAMALSGLALIGFLVVHLAGNLTLYADDTGATFRAYERALESQGPLLLVAEAGLLALFVAHIAMGLRVTLQNREARETRYRIRASMGKSTFASRTMIVTGLLIAVFLVIHIIDFRGAKLLGAERVADMAGAVKHRLASPLGAGIYLVGVTALGLHLSHAFQSAFQTLGLSHPKYTPMIEKLGLLIAVLLFVGFASFPIILFISGGGTD